MNANTPNYFCDSDGVCLQKKFKIQFNHPKIALNSLWRTTWKWVETQKIQRMAIKRFEWLAPQVTVTAILCLSEQGWSYI